MYIKFSYLLTEQTLPASLAGTSGAGSGCSNKQNAGSPDLQRSGVFLGRNRLQILDLALILNEYSFLSKLIHIDSRPMLMGKTSCLKDNAKEFTFSQVLYEEFKVGRFPELPAFFLVEEIHQSQVPL